MARSAFNSEFRISLGSINSYDGKISRESLRQKIQDRFLRNGYAPANARDRRGGEIYLMIRKEMRKIVKGELA